MSTLIGSITVADVDTFIEGAKSAPQEHLDEMGMAENIIYRTVDQNIVFIVNKYNTLEEAQKHKAILESPESKAGLEQMGVKSFDIWTAEEASRR